MKKGIYYLFFLCSMFGFAQSAISGYIPVEDANMSREVHLTQISVTNFTGDKSAAAFKLKKAIASVKADANGFFEFKRNLLADKDAIYKIHVNRFEKALKDTVVVEELFLFSKRDTIYFKKSPIPFSDYVNTNSAHKEWQKLYDFEQQLRQTTLKKEDSLSIAYLGDVKSYTKDSLEILMVKLISIKQLDNKALLEKDIAKNPSFYVAFLQELKESDINRSEYLFLENKLAFLTTEVAESKYAVSKIVNFILGLLIAALVCFVFIQRRRKRKAIPELSKQEHTIQRLILQGKTNKEIANELFISLNTVKTHITNIYSKLQVSNRQELQRKMQNS